MSESTGTFIPAVVIVFGDEFSGAALLVISLCNIPSRNSLNSSRTKASSISMSFVSLSGALIILSHGLVVVFDELISVVIRMFLSYFDITINDNATIIFNNYLVVK